MLVGGFQKCSLIDYPGKLCSVIFTQGCNFKCYYCHNPELVYPFLYSPPIDINTVIQFLKKRINKIDAVVFSGGEPTLQTDLIDIINIFKKLGFLIKIDTNGSKPYVLSYLITNNLVDFIAMDIKTALHNYKSIIYIDIDINLINESIILISNSGISHEFRLTCDNEKITHSDITGINSMLNIGDKLIINPLNAYNFKLKSNLIKNKFI
jgi:pyruvate formate lyase activating enzyme